MDARKPFRIVVAEPFAEEAVSRLKEVGSVTILENSAPKTLISALQEADALLVRARTHVTARIIDAAPRLKVIGRASPTIDHIDMRAAKKRDIRVVYAPYAAVVSSAEFTLGLILALHRRIPFLDRQLREGNFETIRHPTVHEIGHQTIGFLGIDAVAEKLGSIISTVFGSKLIYYDPFGVKATTFDAREVSLETLLADTDILTIHLRVSGETRGFMNAERIRKMKSSAILVNTSRGTVVNTAALAEALKEGCISGAALDVFENEPLSAHHPLCKEPNCILTPHVAGATLDATARRFNVAEDVVRVLKGESPKYPFSHE